MEKDFKVLKLDHIGIAVGSIEEQLRVWQNLPGLKMIETKEIPDQKIKVAIFNLGNLHIELIEPLTATSSVHNFIKKRGEGLHHLCFEVDNIDTALALLKDRGVRLVDEKPRTGAWAKKIAFIHPKSMGGVLVELSEH